MRFHVSTHLFFPSLTCAAVVTLPQEHFDLIERAAVSKPPQRSINPRFVKGVADFRHSLNALSTARNGDSIMISFIEVGSHLFD